MARYPGGVPARCPDGTRPPCSPDRMTVEALGMTLPDLRPFVASWVPALLPDGRPLFRGTARGRESADSTRGSHLTTTSAGQSAGCRRVAYSEEPHGSQTPHRHQH